MVEWNRVLSAHEEQRSIERGECEEIKLFEVKKK